MKKDRIVQKHLIWKGPFDSNCFKPISDQKNSFSHTLFIPIEFREWKKLFIKKIDNFVLQYVHDNFIARKGSAGDVSMKFIQSACYKNSSNRCAGNSRHQVSPRSWFIHGSVIVHSWLGPISARSRDECSYVTQCLFFIDESFILFLPRFYIMWLKSLRKHRVVLRYFYLHNIFIQWEKSII